jgi:PNGase C-terminal domain, mannose-binding module PAW
VEGNSNHDCHSIFTRTGVWEDENIARKVEGDWNMVYLARREGTTAKGTITWKVQVRHICSSKHVHENTFCAF